jgi:hypothetical protein
MPRVGLLFAAAMTFALAGCELIGDIFQAGVWTGVILVVAVLAVIGFVAAKLLK